MKKIGIFNLKGKENETDGEDIYLLVVILLTFRWKNGVLL